MRNEIRQTAYYGLIGSTALLLARVGIKGSQQWERVQRVAQGVFLASAAVVLYDTFTPLSKEGFIAKLAAVKEGGLEELDRFAYDDDKQFKLDWQRDGRTEESLQEYTNQALIKKFFHQGLGNAVVEDLRQRFNIDEWHLQLGMTGEPKFDIEEDDNTLKIIYTGTLQLLDGLIKTPLSKLTSTLAVDIESKSATSFTYTLEPLDDFE